MGGPLVRGQDAKHHPWIQLKVLFQDKVDDAGAVSKSLEHDLGVAFGLGGLGGGHGNFQGLTKPEKAALAEIILELVLGPADLGLEVGLVAVQSRGAEVVLLAEGGQGGRPGR